MDGSLPPSAGSAGSARALGGSLLALARTRAELAAIEVREGAERHKRQLALGLVAAIFLAVSLLLFALIVVTFFWDTDRMAAMIGITVLYAVIGTGTVLRLRKEVQESPPPMSATLDEFRKDLDLWSQRNG